MLGEKIFKFKYCININKKGITLVALKAGTFTFFLIVLAMYEATRSAVLKVCISNFDFHNKLISQFIIDNLGEMQT